MSYFSGKQIFVDSACAEAAGAVKVQEEQVSEMSTFERAMDFVLEWEGGYVNHPSDPGGETNYGISKKSYPDVDIKNLRKDQAMNIYRKYYWYEIRGDELPSAIAIAVMDYAVNSGVKRASRALQNLVHAEVDGQIGPLTIKQVQIAADHLGAKIVAQKVVMQRSDFLCGLISNPDMIPFMKGWMRRTHSLMAEVAGEGG
jgi:lysozyme family protein